MTDAKCKICRRQGTKLFLKGERCLSPKCTLLKKAYPPGQRSKRRPRNLSEYGTELREKQKLKNWYNLQERQFRQYVKKILKDRSKAEDADVLLIKTLESRLDNVIFRLGFSSSRVASRQMVSHGHFLVNGKPMNIPSFFVKKGDTIQVRPKSTGKALFQKITAVLKKHNPPSWLKLDAEKLEGKVVGQPSLEEAGLAVEISSIFEFYSR